MVPMFLLTQKTVQMDSALDLTCWAAASRNSLLAYRCVPPEAHRRAQRLSDRLNPMWDFLSASSRPLRWVCSHSRHLSVGSTSTDKTVVMILKILQHNIRVVSHVCFEVHSGSGNKKIYGNSIPVASRNPQIMTEFSARFFLKRTPPTSERIVKGIEGCSPS